VREKITGAAGAPTVGGATYSSGGTSSAGGVIIPGLRV